MFLGTLFSLVPRWTVLYIEEGESRTGAAVVSEDEAGRVAQLIYEQSSRYRNLIPVPWGLTHPDFCWLGPERHMTAFPTLNEINDAWYPGLRNLVFRVASNIAPDRDSGKDQKHSQYIAFCLEFFRMQDSDTADANSARVRRSDLLKILDCLTARFASLTQTLAEHLVAGIHFADDPAEISSEIVERASSGFVSEPICLPKQMHESVLISQVTRLLRGGCALDLRARLAIFRLERFVNATQLDVQHQLRLARDNLQRNYDALHLALRLLSRNYNEEHRHRRWQAFQVPLAVNPELDFGNLTEKDSFLTAVEKTDNLLFNKLLHLMAARSASIAEDGSVHQKFWNIRRANGRTAESTENLWEHLVKERRWTHSVIQTHESVEKFFASLSGKIIGSMTSMLMTGKAGVMRDMLLRWPALRCFGRNRHVTSFPNGVFNTSSGQFISAGHPQRLLPATLHAVKYFKNQQFPSTALNLILGAGMHFGQGSEHSERNEHRSDHEQKRDEQKRDEEDEQMTQKYPEEEISPEDTRARACLDFLKAAFLLPTRHARIVLQTQEFTDLERSDILAMMGRTRHGIRERDNWDVMCIFLGVAGTGKSTVLYFLHHLFEKESFGIMSNRIERVFGLYAFYDKMIVFGFDLNDKFQLDQALLHSMICGEGVTIPRKNLGTLSVLWSTHLVWGMNVLPSRYQDSDFSLLRRLGIFKFDKIVSKRYPRLMKDFKMLETPFFLFQIVLFYEQLLAKKPGASFWELCQPKFLKTRKNLMGELSVLQGFLRSTLLNRTPLVQIKLDLAGMSARDKAAYKEEYLPLLYARFAETESNEVAISFPDKSVLLYPKPMAVPKEAFWNRFQQFCKERKKMSPKITPDLYDGIFERYGITESHHLEGFSQGAYVGVCLKD